MKIETKNRIYDTREYTGYALKDGTLYADMDKMNKEIAECHGLEGMPTDIDKAIYYGVREEGKEEGLYAPNDEIISQCYRGALLLVEHIAQNPEKYGIDFYFYDWETPNELQYKIFTALIEVQARDNLDTMEFDVLRAWKSGKFTREHLKVMFNLSEYKLAQILKKDKATEELRIMNEIYALKSKKKAFGKQ